MRHWTVYRCPSVSVDATGQYSVSSSFSIRHWTVCRVQQFQYTPLDAVLCPARNSTLCIARNVPDMGRKGITTVNLWVWHCKHMCRTNISVHCVQKHVGRQNKSVHLLVVASLWLQVQAFPTHLWLSSLVCNFMISKSPSPSGALLSWLSSKWLSPSVPLKFCHHDYKTGGTRWRIWLKHCAISRKVAGSIPDGVIGIFHRLKPCGCNMSVVSTQTETEMRNWVVSWRG